MSIYYNGLHSITFTDTTIRQNNGVIYSKNTWLDFKLVPTSNQTITVPTPAISIQSIPGTKSVIDTTTLFANKLLYSRRIGSWNFYLDVDSCITSGTSEVEVIEVIKDFFNGRSLYCELEDSNRHVSYFGRIYAKEIKNTNDYPEIEIAYDLDYETLSFSVSKDLYKIASIWDDFSDATGQGRDQPYVTVNSIIPGIITVDELNLLYRPAVLIHNNNRVPDLRIIFYSDNNYPEPVSFVNSIESKILVLPYENLKFHKIDNTRIRIEYERIRLEPMYGWYAGFTVFAVARSNFSRGASI